MVLRPCLYTTHLLTKSGTNMNRILTDEDDVP